eukprot:2550525-Alexandrium_andersonii.AAC.1
MPRTTTHTRAHTHRRTHAFAAVIRRWRPAFYREQASGMTSRGQLPSFRAIDGPSSPRCSAEAVRAGRSLPFVAAPSPVRTGAPRNR